MASLVFWKQSTNSASEGGRARSVRTPSAAGSGGREGSARPAPRRRVWPQVRAGRGRGPDLPAAQGPRVRRTLTAAPPSSVSPSPRPPRPRTCRRLLPLLLPLLALVQLLERLCRLLQPRHEPLDVVQGAVEDLLRAGRGQRAPGPAGTAPPLPLGRVRPGPTYRLLLYLLSQHGPRRLLVQRLPTAEACGVRGTG